MAVSFFLWVSLCRVTDLSDALDVAPAKLVRVRDLDTSNEDSVLHTANLGQLASQKHSAVKYVAARRSLSCEGLFGWMVLDYPHFHKKFLS